MDKTAIKNFSIWARKKAIADVSNKAAYFGITAKEIKSPLPQSTPDLQFIDIGAPTPTKVIGKEIEQRNALLARIKAKEAASGYKTAYNSVMEEVAYTWFNRLIAIRFMEVNDYLPSHTRVLSSEDPKKLEPDFVTNPFDTDLAFTKEEQNLIHKYKEENKLGMLFRLLFIKQCNKLNEILPELFEKTNDYSELLLNISFTDQEGLVYHLTHDISEDDFNVEKEGQIEIIGWIYQFYNTEPKDESYALLKKNVKITKERIPSVTQLFTPDWIVRYMVENSLGRLWTEGHPNDKLKSNWKYYLEEAEQESSVKEQLAAIREEYKKLTPEDIKIIDPCMGSGHILVYAFDVLMQIYQSCGYTPKDAAVKIIEKNLYGLDIDDRAYQLAYFAVMMKGRQYNRTIFSRSLKPNLFSIQESTFITEDLIEFISGKDKKLEKYILSLKSDFTDAKEYGSIINVHPVNFEALFARLDEIAQMKDPGAFELFYKEETIDKFLPFLKQAAAMVQKYDVVVTNPPYMGSGMNDKLSKFVKENYPDSKSDLFAVFIEKCDEMVRRNRYQAMITQQSWMFLSSYVKLRKKMMQIETINMAHLGARAFDEIGGEVVQPTVFVRLKVSIDDYIATYARLVGPKNQKGKEDMFLAKINCHLARQEYFSQIPCSPIAYWISNKVLKSFNNEGIGAFAEIISGMTTGDNDEFLRIWTEININTISFNKTNLSQIDIEIIKWIPYHKGGEQRKWYGNHKYLVNWSQSNNFNRAKTTMTHVYLKPCITWSDISGNSFAARFCNGGFMFDVKGSCAFSSLDMLILLIGLFNSKITPIYVEALNPTSTTQVGDLKRIPFIEPTKPQAMQINELVNNSINISKTEWDDFEFSWDFKFHPFIAHKSNDQIETSYKNWEEFAEKQFYQLKANEEELNRIFIDIYRLQDELTPDVKEKDVTVRKADLGRDIRSFISYAVGCMFGRYSLDVEGLAYAGGVWDQSKYKTYIPDVDNCIPITDEEYFDDDVVSRFVDFVKTVYGKDTLGKNLEFIAEALGNRGDTPLKTIRNYFINEFYKDHVKIYQKRPIYWLFESGKENSFKALIYMHRYNADTIGNMRIEYIHKLQVKYESQLSFEQHLIDTSQNQREKSAAMKQKEKLIRQIKEIKDYDVKIAHLANCRIEIDLDDGVKVNYEKVQTGKDGKKLEVLGNI